jgi:hypothetical protein
MTVQTTTIQHSKREVLGLIGATVFTCAVLGGVALWQVWPSGQAAAPATRATTSAAIAFVPEPESPLNAPVAGATGGAAVAPARTILTVDSVDQVATAYSEFVERMRALDGSVPLAVTVVIAAGSTDSMARLFAEWDQEQRYAETVAAIIAARMAVTSELDSQSVGVADHYRDQEFEIERTAAPNTSEQTLCVGAVCLTAR